jgi:hypothetical protein
MIGQHPTVPVVNCYELGHIRPIIKPKENTSPWIAYEMSINLRVALAKFKILTRDGQESCGDINTANYLSRETTG